LVGLDEATTNSREIPQKPAMPYQSTVGEGVQTTFHANEKVKEPEL